MKVPSGPRKPIRTPARPRAPEVRRGPWTGRIVNIMDELALQRLLDDVRSGACSPDDAVLRLRRLPFADLGSPRWTTTGASARACPRPSTARARRADQCSAIVGELLPGRDGTSAARR